MQQSTKINLAVIGTLAVAATVAAVVGLSGMISAGVVFGIAGVALAYLLAEFSAFAITVCPAIAALRADEDRDRVEGKL